MSKLYSGRMVCQQRKDRQFTTAGNKPNCRFVGVSVQSFDTQQGGVLMLHKEGVFRYKADKSLRVGSLYPKVYAAGPMTVRASGHVPVGAVIGWTLEGFALVQIKAEDARP